MSTPHIQTVPSRFKNDHPYYSNLIARNWHILTAQKKALTSLASQFPAIKHAPAYQGIQSELMPLNAFTLYEPTTFHPPNKRLEPLEKSLAIIRKWAPYIASDLTQAYTSTSTSTSTSTLTSNAVSILLQQPSDAALMARGILNQHRVGAPRTIIDKLFNKKKPFWSDYGYSEMDGDLGHLRVTLRVMSDLCLVYQRRIQENNNSIGENIWWSAALLAITDSYIYSFHMKKLAFSDNNVVESKLWRN